MLTQRLGKTASANVAIAVWLGEEEEAMVRKIQQQNDRILEQNERLLRLLEKSAEFLREVGGSAANCDRNLWEEYLLRTQPDGPELPKREV